MSNTNQSSPILSYDQVQLIKELLLGGTALGGGLALTTSMINYLKHLSRKNSSSNDDDTMYVYKKPITKQAKKISEPYEWSRLLGLDTGLAATAGILSTIGSYALVNKLYKTLRKKQAQDELDAAQHAFFDTQGYEELKKKADAASENTKPITPSDIRTPNGINWITGGLTVTLPILLALAAAGGTSKFLDKQFPIKKPKVKAPRRIEIIDPEEAALLQQEKYASVQNDLGETDACEFLLRTVLAEKQANSDVRNIVSAVAMQGIKPFKTAVETVGYADALNLVKGASANKIHPFKEHLAVCMLAKSARLRDLVALTAAGEFAESHPEIIRAMSDMADDDKDTFYKMSCVLGRAYRMEISSDFGINRPEKEFTKQALSDEVFNTLVEQVATRLGDDSSDTSGEEAGLNDPDSPSRNKKHKVKFILNGTSSKRVLDGLPSEDIIDQILDPEPSDA